ncbi:YihY/virulence factor BrkB family protein [Kitasatospora sp. RB6PN24]|uniref:YihY/virulence factor BrkB family protein n=1 Tax=Kitasatospora humi TaxID=2893891 RepID=UPI001E567FF5|nr:YihY/virulence factor BrkB family protein [Kitasatospora humi]MCC9305743.1 YihY/virulence factor BrkB family protein [Kitasatospora humi]
MDRVRKTKPGPQGTTTRRAPDRPSRLPSGSWRAVAGRTVKEFKADQLGDRAATLTYYGILALFPALLVLVSLIGLAGRSATDQALANVQRFAPGAARNILVSAIQQLQGRAGLGSAMVIVGLLLALWSASGYVAAFIRAANAVYDMPEGRPVWKLTPLRVALTAALMAMAAASALIVVFTGSLAERAGAVLGAGHTAVTVWSVAKWPVLVVLVSLMIALLYWAAPNARGRGFRWLTPGSVVALVIWVVASAGFSVYVANFGSYNKTYGTLAGIIIFLVWLWITNLAILLGLEFDAELARERAIVSGHPPDAEPYVEPRDTSKWSEEERHQAPRTPPGASGT